MTLVLWGVPIHISFGFCLLLAVFLHRDWVGLGTRLLFAVALHEGAHLLALRLFGERPKEMAFSCVGVRITRSSRRLDWWKNALVLLAGPVANLLLYLLLRSRMPGLPLQNRFFVFANLLLGGFNLLPIAPLDGGNLLHLLLGRLLPRQKAEKAALAVGVGVLGALALPALLLVWTQGNFTLLLTWGYLGVLLWKNRGEGQG